MHFRAGRTETAHRSAKAQRWCELRIEPAGLLKEGGVSRLPYGPNPDRAIVQQGLNKQKPAASPGALQLQLKREWSKSKPSVLHSLIASRPNRVCAQIPVRGEYSC